MPGSGRPMQRISKRVFLFFLLAVGQAASAFHSMCSRHHGLGLAEAPAAGPPWHLRAGGTVQRHRRVAAPAPVADAANRAPSVCFKIAASDPAPQVGAGAGGGAEVGRGGPASGSWAHIRIKRFQGRMGWLVTAIDAGCPSAA